MADMKHLDFGLGDDPWRSGPRRPGRRFGRRKVTGVSLAVAMVVSLAAPMGANAVVTAPAGSTPAAASGFEGFIDAPAGRFFSTPVNWAGSTGVTNGIGNDRYAPSRTITRAEVITWLYRLSGDETLYPDAGFPDSQANNFFFDAVNWAKATGVTEGVENGARFGSFDPVNRGQMVAFLYRAADSPEVAPGVDFDDVASTNRFYDPVNWARDNNVTTGVGGSNRFNPLGQATRAEAITFLFRAEHIGVGIDADHDSAVRMNEIQMMGTHNSYRLRPAAPLFNRLMQLRDIAVGFGLDPYQLDYGHRPLAEQFTRLGARQIELDVFADPDGGLYSNRSFNGSPLILGPKPPEASGEPALDEPGFKVLHVQDLDYATHCLTFVACLTEVRDWSLANPNHLPIMILVELKDEPLPDGLDTIAGDNPPAVPPQITSGLLDDLDEEIREVFDDGHVITPDSVRVDGKTLRESIVDDGWPTLADSRGKVMLGLDNTGSVSNLYAEGKPNLEGRMMFADRGSISAEGAAFFKRNSPGDPSIPELIAEGFMVRTRADVPYDSLLPDPDDPTGPARGIGSRRSAWASGASWLSSDYLEPTDSTFPYTNPADDIRGNLFTSFIPSGGVARCNPVAVNPACTNRLLLNDLIPVS